MPDAMSRMNCITSALVRSFKRNRHVQHSVSRPLYALRSRIECFINRLKNSRRVATRYDQTADSFLGFAALSSIRLWIKFVHAT